METECFVGGCKDEVTMEITTKKGHTICSCREHETLLNDFVWGVI